MLWIHKKNKLHKFKMAVFQSFLPTAFWLLRSLEKNHAILNLSPSWKDVTSIPLFSLYKRPLARLKYFNVQSICSLAYIEEMSRSIIFTFTGKLIWRCDENNRSDFRVFLSKRFLLGSHISVQSPGKKKKNIHKAVCFHCLSSPTSWIIKHLKKVF